MKNVEKAGMYEPAEKGEGRGGDAGGSGPFYFLSKYGLISL